MATTQTPPSSWIEEGLRALAENGPDGVRVEVLARALGVTKGGFYWHFDDRRALLDEMLDTFERKAVDEVIERVDSMGGDGRTRLRHLSALAASRPDVLSIDIAIRDWARRDPRIARRLRRVDNRRMEFMRTQFRDFCAGEEEVEIRSMLAFSLWLGDHFMAADHGGRSRADVMGLAMQWLLE